MQQENIEDLLSVSLTGETREKYRYLFARRYNSEEEHPPLLYYDDIQESIPYQESANLCATNTHIGQRKLFLTEMHFLTEQISPEKEAIVFSIGGAPGIHTGLLSGCFPNVKFVLIDPAPFNVRNAKPVMMHTATILKNFEYVENPINYTKMLGILRKIKVSKEKIFLLNCYFTDELARACVKIFPESYIICDIRGFVKGMRDEFDILWNLAMQYNWVTIMKPLASHLKFRFPFYERKDAKKWKLRMEEKIYKDTFINARKNGIDFEEYLETGELVYLDGIIELQAWAPLSSTETRLISTSLELRNWGTLKGYENKMFYYNNIERCFGLHENDNANSRLGFDHCNDCALENLVWKKYIKKYHSGETVLDFVAQLSPITRPLLSSESHHGKFFGKYQEKDFKACIKTEVRF